MCSSAYYQIYMAVAVAVFLVMTFMFYRNVSSELEGLSSYGLIISQSVSSIQATAASVGAFVQSTAADFKTDADSITKDISGLSTSGAAIGSDLGGILTDVDKLANKYAPSTY